MNSFFIFFIFSIVLFLYLHVYYHLKTSEDLDVFTLTNPSKEKLEEVCNIRQPVLFKMFNEEIQKNFNLEKLQAEQNIFEINVRNKNENQYLPLAVEETIQLLKKDNNYITENNEDFLQETRLQKILRHNDILLRPPMVSSCSYDLLSGSAKSSTVLRYGLNYRNYIFVTEGSLKIRLISPAFLKYTHLVEDYDMFEFRSPIDIWNVQEKYKHDFKKIKYIDVNLDAGDILYIPAYWLWSIQFEELSVVIMFQYRTYMNTVAILPQLFIHTLQKLNTKWDIVDKIKSGNFHLRKIDPKETEHPKSD